MHGMKNLKFMVYTHTHDCTFYYVSWYMKVGRVAQSV